MDTIYSFKNGLEVETLTSVDTRRTAEGEREKKGTKEDCSKTKLIFLFHKSDHHID